MVYIAGSGGQVIVTVNPLGLLHSLTDQETETEQDHMRLSLLQYQFSKWNKCWFKMGGGSSFNLNDNIQNIYLII